MVGRGDKCYMCNIGYRVVDVKVWETTLEFSVETRSPAEQFLVSASAKISYKKQGTAFQFAPTQKRETLQRPSNIRFGIHLYILLPSPNNAANIYSHYGFSLFFFSPPLILKFPFFSAKI